MDADALLRPRGPLPPGVYWRRRLITFALVVLAATLLVRSCGTEPADRLGTSPSASPTVTRKPSATVRPSTSARPSASAAPTRAAGQPCRRSDLKVQGLADQRAYAAGARPVLTITVTNVGPVACTRDFGSAATELRVMSGSSRVWSSDDCTRAGTASVVTFTSGQRRTSTVTWSRKHSQPGCAGARQDAAAGTYRVVARLGDIVVTGTAFTLA